MLSTRTALAAATFLLLAMVAPATASADHLTDTISRGGPTVPWGFNEFWGFSGDGDEWSAEQSDREIALANAIMPRDQSAHRLFVQWRRVEFTEDLYETDPTRWAVTDAAYQAMQGAEPERKPVMVIHDAPDWAHDSSDLPPEQCECIYPPDRDHDEDWQEFVQDAVTRYPNVRAIEVWNEPNLPRFWGLDPAPARYVRVLEAAHDAVVAAGSSAPVITGGLAPVEDGGKRIASDRFLTRIYTDANEVPRPGVQETFEGIGTHPFTMSKKLLDDMWFELDRLFAVRNTHDDDPAGTPLWITEISVSSDPTVGVGPQRQGTELARLYRSIKGHEIESFIIFRFHDCADDPTVPCAGFANLFFNNTGVVEQNLVPKPAYCNLGAQIGVPAIGVSCVDTP
jgi:hypothetical protein